jgi:hypothetical protein
MRKSLSEIYESVEQKNSELSYNEYVLVIDALEWKEKAGVLKESLNNEDDLVYWVESVRINQSNLNEWSIEDFSNLVNTTKEKAIAAGKTTLKVAIDLVDKFKDAYAVTYDAFLQLGIGLKLGMNEVFNTLREKGLWEALKSVKTLAIESISDLYTLYTSAYKETSDIIFGTIDKTKIGEYLEKGTNKIQELVKAHPKLKYLLGPIIAYTLYYIWTKMVFKGDFIYDFDWSTNFRAFMGDFDVVEIFSGQGGIELMTWFALGLSDMFPSAAWLDGELQSLFGGWGNHALAILATIMIFLHDKYPQVFERPLIQTIKNKLCKRDQKLNMKKTAIDTLRELGVRRNVYKPCDGPKCGA